jgi:hypothetical protein
MIITEGLNELNVVMVKEVAKTWLTWQEEILSQMSTHSATTDKIKTLYNRFQSDLTLAILGMTLAEQEALRQNLVNYLQNISYGNYTGPTDLLSLLGPGVFGLSTDQINFVYNGRQ